MMKEDVYGTLSPVFNIRCNKYKSFLVFSYSPYPHTLPVDPPAVLLLYIPFCGNLTKEFKIQRQFSAASLNISAGNIQSQQILYTSSLRISNLQRLVKHTAHTES